MNNSDAILKEEKKKQLEKKVQFYFTAGLQEKIFEIFIITIHVHFSLAMFNIFSFSYGEKKNKPKKLCEWEINNFSNHKKV